MTASNHAITGALLAAAIPEPAIALPLAFVSHFVLDSIPHFGVHDMERIIKKRLFSLVVGIDTICLITLFLVLWHLHDSFWIIMGAIVAISPDFAWIYRYIFKEKWGKFLPGPKGAFNRFHSSFQRELNKGWIIEIAWFSMVLTVLLIR